MLDVGKRLNPWKPPIKRASFQFAVVYGRRRVGKTSLLRVFTQGKPHVIFFTGQQTVASENLALLSREILGDSAAGAAFPSIQVALESVFEHAKTEQIVLIIDEYPYLAESDPASRRACKRLSIDIKTRASCSSYSRIVHELYGTPGTMTPKPSLWTPHPAAAH